MAEYIEREALLAKLNSKVTRTDPYGIGIIKGLEIASEVAKRMPYREIPAADVVEVVRCKDCKRGEVDGPEYDPDLYFCQLGCGLNKGHFFCAFGERRGEDG